MFSSLPSHCRRLRIAGAGTGPVFRCRGRSGCPASYKEEEERRDAGVINGIGFLVILACVFGSFIVAGRKMAVILHALPHEMVAIGGASLGAFLVGNSLRTAKLAGRGLVRAFKAGASCG